MLPFFYIIWSTVFIEYASSPQPNYPVKGHINFLQHVSYEVCLFVMERFPVN